jgi:hypothetical protein
VDNLKEIVNREVTEYAGEALNGYSYLTSDTNGNFHTIVSVGQVRGERIVETDLIVRLVGEKIIIERDRNSKPLYQALLAAGIPREQIILAYAGEAVEEAS